MLYSVLKIVLKLKMKPCNGNELTHMQSCCFLCWGFWWFSWCLFFFIFFSSGERLGIGIEWIQWGTYPVLSCTDLFQVKYQKLIKLFLSSWSRLIYMKRKKFGFLVLIMNNLTHVNIYQDKRCPECPCGVCLRSSLKKSLLLQLT